LFKNRIIPIFATPLEKTGSSLKITRKKNGPGIQKNAKNFAGMSNTCIFAVRLKKKSAVLSKTN